jgi:site-specific recombinase XerD
MVSVNFSNHSGQDLLDRYHAYLCNYRDLAVETMDRHRVYTQWFLEWLDNENDPDKSNNLTFEGIQKFIFHYGKNHGARSRAWMHYALRSFLHFCYINGYVDRDFSPAIPSVRRLKLSHVPFGIDQEKIFTLLQSINKATPADIRDYAMIQLLATYGVRGVQIRKLKLEHILWRKSQIQFPAAKGGKQTIQPLTDDAGNALLRYIQKSRPYSTSYPQVFLTLSNSIRPLNSPSTLSNIIAYRLRKAHISIPTEASHGSHIFRHGFATRMINNNQSIKIIADMLGHRSIDSTFIYTKVDFQTLQNIPLEWPEVI